MNYWLRFPYVRITSVFILGLLLAHYLGLAGLLVPALLFVLGLVLKTAVYKNGILGLSAIALVAGLWWMLHEPRCNYRQTDRFVGKVIAAKTGESFIRYEVQILEGRDSTHWYTSSERMMITTQKELKVDEIVSVHGSPQRVQAPRNPLEFDYRTYLFYKGICRQLFVDAREVKQIGAEQTWVTTMLIEIQESGKGIINRHLSETTAPVALALFLGQRDHLGDSLRKAYAHTGIVHLLAVSGLHLGILYGLVVFLFRSTRTWTFVAVALLVVWSFAMITGMPPSVVRAAVMFSLLTIAKRSNRKYAGINALFVSALIQLLVNPMLIFDVGFQLSNLAVLGILLFYVPINRWVSVPRAFNWAWQIVSVSLAAQIIVAPILLFYFHGFSLAFLVSNLIAIPVTTAILVTGVAFFVAAALGLDVLVSPLAQVMDKLLQLMNHLALRIERLPFAYIDDVFLTTGQLFLVYGMLISVVLLFIRQKFVYVCTFTVLSGAFILDRYWRPEPAETVIYATPGNLIIDHFNGHSIASFGYRDNPFSTRNYRMSRSGRSSVDSLPVRNTPVGRLLQIGHRTAFIPNASFDQTRYKHTPKVDILILSHNAPKDLKRLDNLHNGLVLLDGTIHFWYAQRVEEFYSGTGVEIISVRDSAFTIKEGKWDQ